MEIGRCVSRLETALQGLAVTFRWKKDAEDDGRRGDDVAYLEFWSVLHQAVLAEKPLPEMVRGSSVFPSLSAFVSMVTPWFQKEAVLPKQQFQSLASDAMPLQSLTKSLERFIPNMSTSLTWRRRCPSGKDILQAWGREVHFRPLQRPLQCGSLLPSGRLRSDIRTQTCMRKQKRARSWRARSVR